MRTRSLIASVAVVALLATACDSAEEDQPADTEQADDADGDDEDRVDGGDAQQNLEDAVATTLEQGPAEFHATSQGADGAGSAAGTDAEEDGATDEDVTTDTDRPTQIYVEGVVDFGQGLRELSLIRTRALQEADISVLLDGDNLYVQLPDDASSGDDEVSDEPDDDDSAEAQWARVGMDELGNLESRAGQLLLHDPYPMLHALQDATVDVREGTPIGAQDSDEDGVGGEGTPSPTPDSDEDGGESEGTTSGEDDSADDGLADPPDFIATIDPAESDQPALEALSEQMDSDELDVQVWVEPAIAGGDFDETAIESSEDAEVDERVQQLVFSVPAAAVGELGDATEDAGATDEDRDLRIELTNFGSDIDIEVPEDDQVAEADVDEVRAMLSDQRESVEPTPTPDADDADEDGNTDS